jgi:hypothetical protein
MRKTSVLVILLVFCTWAAEAKSANVSELVADVTTGFDSVRTNAENKATEIITEIEKSKVFRKINGTVSELVKTIFKGYNMVVDKAEEVAKDMVSKIEAELKTNKKDSKNRAKRDVEDRIENIKNKTVHLGNCLFLVIYHSI